MATQLCKIMERYGSDKSVRNHNYTLVYSKLFDPIRQNKLRIFELGLGTNNTDVPSNMGPEGKPGASVYGWAEYFPNSAIFGADIDKRILFNTNRINTFYCDQTNPESIKELWNNPLLANNFDIIVEDALHCFVANIIFFENSIHKLNKGGYYIIEDILTTDIEKFKNKIVEWKKTYNCEFTLVKIPSLRNNVDNNLLVVRNLNKSCHI